MKIIERTFDAITGETTETERNETAAEKAQRETAEANAQAAILAETTKAAEKAALLERLGITADEAALLLS
jgi:hypothetical protein